MVLVSYSDSEDSDSDARPTLHPTAKPAAASSNIARPAFRKVVDRSNPGKIRVNLAEDAPTPSDEPPTKKPRTSTSTFSDFNSFLPAPKRSSEASRGTAKRNRGQGLGQGVPLKTSAAPGFSREPVEETGPHGSSSQPVEEVEVDNDSYGPDTIADKAQPAEDVKLVGRPMMFKPLSVANTSKKPRKTVLSQRKVTPHTPSDREVAAVATAPKPKPKISLFSIPQEEGSPVSNDPTAGYHPVFDLSQPTCEASDTASQSTEARDQPHNPTVREHTESQSLDTIAADLSLTAAQKRLLFGRHNGKNNPAPSTINVVNFNTDQEYAHNEELRAAGESIQHHPVRAIAPGKHSLKQLMNNATAQKDALEEHFIIGRRNKKEASSKYGW